MGGEMKTEGRYVYVAWRLFQVQRANDETTNTVGS
jgi:hypothetical protein